MRLPLLLSICVATTEDRVLRRHPRDVPEWAVLTGDRDFGARLSGSDLLGTFTV